MKHLTFSIEPVSPFRLDLTAWAIRRRPENIIDWWDGETYRRVLPVSGRSALVSVVQSSQPNGRLDVTVSSDNIRRTTQSDVTMALERLLGTRIDLQPFYKFARHDRKLQQLTQRFIGLKPPRFPTIFEALVNGIACQQLSLAVGIILLGRLADHFGLSFGDRHGLPQHAFPRPEDLAQATTTDLKPLGFSTNKSRALIDLSAAITNTTIDVEGLTPLDNEAILERLLQLRGIGRWTGEYVLLRGFGRTDLFPADDVGARNNLARWMRLKEPPDYAHVRRILARWAPYGGLIYFHLLLDKLEKTGRLAAHYETPSLPLAG